MAMIRRKSRGEIYEDLKARIIAGTSESKRPTNWNVGSVIRTLTEEVSESIAELYGLGFEVLKQGFMATASGIYLDSKVSERDKERIEALHTEGVVRFFREFPRDTNVPIPVDTIVSTYEDGSGRSYRYRTLAAVVLASGSTSVQVAVRAVETGAAYNVGAGTIKRIGNPISGVDGVTNAVDWITQEGRDDERDDPLRRRGFLAWEEIARGTRDAAYLVWALDAGATDAFVRSNEPRGPGTVDIYILGPDGMPSDELVAAVQAYIDARRPSETSAGDILVRKPVATPIDIGMTVTPKAGFSTQALEAEIASRIDAHFNPTGDENYPSVPSLGVGGDVLVNRIINIIMAVPGVYNVDLVSPTSDVEVADNQLAVLQSLSVSFGEAAP